jgi:putative addiction module antidote
MVQKILQVGNSAAVSISKKYLELLNLSVGDQIQIEFFPETKKIVLSVPETEPEAISDIELLRKLKSLEKRYGRLYHKLAQAE